MKEINEINEMKKNADNTGQTNREEIGFQNLKAVSLRITHTQNYPSSIDNHASEAKKKKKIKPQKTCRVLLASMMPTLQSRLLSA